MMGHMSTRGVVCLVSVTNSEWFISLFWLEKQSFMKYSSYISDHFFGVIMTHIPVYHGLICIPVIMV